MTDTEYTPQRVKSLIELNHIVAAVPVCIIPSPLAAAQWAGDEAYDATLATTHDGNQAAVAYHLACRAVLDRAGYGPCECDLCQLDDPEPGVENPANHAAELAGW